MQVRILPCALEKQVCEGVWFTDDLKNFKKRIEEFIIMVKKECVICGKMFMPRDKRSVCCSNKCGNLRHKRRFRAKRSSV